MLTFRDEKMGLKRQGMPQGAVRIVGVRAGLRGGGSGRAYRPVLCEGRHVVCVPCVRVFREGGPVFGVVD